MSLSKPALVSIKLLHGKANIDRRILQPTRYTLLTLIISPIRTYRGVERTAPWDLRSEKKKVDAHRWEESLKCAEDTRHKARSNAVNGQANK